MLKVFWPYVELIASYTTQSRALAQGITECSWWACVWIFCTTVCTMYSRATTSLHINKSQYYSMHMWNWNIQLIFCIELFMLQFIFITTSKLHTVYDMCCVKISAIYFVGYVVLQIINYWIFIVFHFLSEILKYSLYSLIVAEVNVSVFTNEIQIINNYNRKANVLCYDLECDYFSVLGNQILH